MKCPKCGSQIESELVIYDMKVAIRTYKHGFSPEKGEFEAPKKAPKFRPKPIA
jgi:hypothetical protein